MNAQRASACFALMLTLWAAPSMAQKKPAASAPPPCVASRVDAAVAGAPSAFRDCAGSPVMVVIPAGTFRMGDVLGTGLAYEQPVHEVRLRSFAIGRYELTQAEWAACVGAGACEPVENAVANARLPLTQVSWIQTQQYTAWLSARSGRRYRLPSEAEWEYAVRAGSDTQFTWGNFTDLACRHANGFDRAGHRAYTQWNWQIECNDGFAAAAPVGSFAANAWGLHDMLGNVWEWVADCWHADYENAPVDGSARLEASCRKHVNRGGGWGNHPRTLRVSNRDGDEAGASSDGLGFRVARDLTP